MGMNLAQLVEQLNQELQPPAPLTPDPKGVYNLPFNETLSVAIVDNNPGVQLTCQVAPCPKNEEEALFQEMMLGNLFGQGTQGAVLGLSQDGKALTLSLEIDYNPDYKDFRDLLEDFLNTADFWRDQAEKAEEQH